MKIAVVLSNQAVIDPLVNPDTIRQISETVWGSWHQWHQCRPTDVVCHDTQVADHLIAGQLHHQCNLWLSENATRIFTVPQEVRLYGGDFVHEVAAAEEIVALHLAAVESDIVVLLGFDWSAPQTVDPLILHQRENRDGLIGHLVGERRDREWIIVADEVPRFLSEFDHVVAESLDSLLT